MWRGFHAFVVPCSGLCLGCIRVCTGALKLDLVRYWVLFVKRFCRVALVCAMYPSVLPCGYGCLVYVRVGVCAMYPSVSPYGYVCLVCVRVPVCMGRVVYSRPYAGRAPKSSHVFVVAHTLGVRV